MSSCTLTYIFAVFAELHCTYLNRVGRVSFPGSCTRSPWLSINLYRSSLSPLALNSILSLLCPLLDFILSLLSSNALPLCFRLPSPVCPYSVLSCSWQLKAERDLWPADSQSNTRAAVQVANVFLISSLLCVTIVRLACNYHGWGSRGITEHCEQHKVGYGIVMY